MSALEVLRGLRKFADSGRDCALAAEDSRLLVDAVSELVAANRDAHIARVNLYDADGVNDRLAKGKLLLVAKARLRKAISALEI